MLFGSLSYHSITLNFSFKVVPDGYGLSYSIGDDYIRWTITSMKKNTAELKHHLAEAASQVKTMLVVSKPESKTKL